MTEELHDTISLGVEFALADVHTIVVAKITAVNNKTISCVPVINRVVKGDSKQLPEFIEVPRLSCKAAAAILLSQFRQVITVSSLFLSAAMTPGMPVATLYHLLRCACTTTLTGLRCAE